VSDSRRLDELELALLRLTREVADLRADVQRLGGAAVDRRSTHEASATPATSTAAGAPPVPPAELGPIHAAPSARASARAAQVGGTARPRVGLAGPGRTFDIEALVGRYGAMALAALTILMAAGTFLGWAIANSRIGPGARVGLGAIGAGLVAAIGWRLRRRGTRRFGNTLLGLALALVHVDAWGAGPLLHVIPPAAALAVAAAASVALAALAWHAREESLFVVGTGGALLAPFVTADGRGNTIVLLIYGWVVLATAVYALRGQTWRVAARLMAAGCLAYTAAAIDRDWYSASGVERNAPALFALACAWSALLWGGAAHRSRLARADVAFALIPLLSYGYFARSFPDVLALAALGTVTAYLALRRPDGGDRRWFVDAVVLPLALLAAALLSLPRGADVAQALGALAWAGAALVAAWDARADEARRAPHLMVAGLASALAVPLAFEEQRLLCVALLAAHAAGVSLALPRARTKLLLVPALASLLLATHWAFEMLDLRPAYAYTPFATTASLAALAVVAAWSVFGAHASRAVLPDANGFGPKERAVAGALGAVAAFFWGRQELGRAYSPDLATFLLILYYASAGVLAIFVGRWRQLPGARRVGLGLAIYAALKAVVQANNLSPIGLRVGSYLAVGGFLLGVAYWYRAAGEASDGEGDGATAAV
jgi:hypothetical protein